MISMTTVPFSRVHIVGAGLLGTSMALALSERGVAVTLADSSPTSLSLARDYGAGDVWEATMPHPELVIVATPPDVVARMVVDMLAAFPEAIVADVASVKGAIYEEILRLGGNLERFVGTHPMAGRERGGAVSARSDLFTARPWIICEGAASPTELVTRLVISVGAIPLAMSFTEHDDAVALVSHLPQLVSTLTAARLSDASAQSLSVAGGGLRDVTRIAASDPGLWAQIIGANAGPLLSQLTALAADLHSVMGALSDLEAKGSRTTLADTLQRGHTGVARLPGKHGVSSHVASLIVVIDDTPGELARLLTQLGQWNVNLEDLRLEHSPGANVGFAEVSLAKNAVAEVEKKLVQGGWKIAGERP